MNELCTFAVALIGFSWNPLQLHLCYYTGVPIIHFRPYLASDGICGQHIHHEVAVSRDTPLFACLFPF